MAEKSNILQELSFGPEWARQPVDSGAQVSFSGRAGKQSDRRHEPRRAGKHPARPDFSSRMPARQNRTHNAAHADAPRRMRSHARNVDMPSQEFQVARNLCRINFIPERRGLRPLASQLARSRRAWPLDEVARMFLSKPDFYAVKLETIPPGQDGDVAEDAPKSLFQCTECFQVFTTRDPAVNHVLRQHFTLFFSQQETQGEPPKGNFSSVARCGLSGTLLGPPNYHLYNEKISELHRTRFSSMPLEVYRRHIVNETDPAIVDKWKQEVAAQIEYTTLRETEPKVFKKYSEAEAFLISSYMSELVSEGQRFIVQGKVATNFEDQQLQQMIRHIWMRENRSPLRITLAVRPAFRQLGLHIFRAADKKVYITSIPPRYLEIDSVTATPEVSFILKHLTQNPNVKIDELAQAWDNTDIPESEKKAVLTQQLHWLTDRGHVIEFFDGKLAVPPAATDQKNAGDKEVNASRPAPVKTR